MEFCCSPKKCEIACAFSMGLLMKIIPGRQQGEPSWRHLLPRQHGQAVHQRTPPRLRLLGAIKDSTAEIPGGTSGVPGLRREKSLSSEGGLGHRWPLTLSADLPKYLELICRLAPFLHLNSSAKSAVSWHTLTLPVGAGAFQWWMVKLVTDKTAIFFQSSRNCMVFHVFSP